MTQLVKRSVLNLSRGLTEQADHLREQGRYQAAEKHYQKALCLLGGDRAPRSELVASILHGLGMTCQCLVRYEDANVYYRRALTILQNQPGPPPPLLALIHQKLNELARNLSQIDDTDSEKMT